MAAASCFAQAWFAGGGPGLSTLSGDARSVITPSATAISQYKPENGALLHAFAGRHVRDYLSFQGAVSWNRNALALVSSRTESGRESTYELAYRSRQFSSAADAMLYFRPRSSFVRPYLSVGIGMMSFRASDPQLRISKGSPALPPATFSATKPGLRAAAGIDLMFRNGWGFRYTFLETIQGNPVSAQLSPTGERGLANFQNLFGLVKYF